MPVRRTSPFLFTALTSGNVAERLRTAFAPRKPRHPLLRVAVGLVGVGVLAVLLVVGLFAGAAMLGAGLLVRAARLLRQRGAPVAAADARIVEAQYTVVRKPAFPQSP